MMTSLEFIQSVIGNLEPAMAFKPEYNLEEWQMVAHEKLTELLGLPLAECEDQFKVLSEKEETDYKSITFQFQSEPGYYVEATLLVPNGITEAIPGVICLQGHSNGAHISLGIAKFPEDEEDIAGGRDFAVRAVQEGFCGIAMDQRYMGEKGQVENGNPACIKKWASMSSLLIGRNAIGERVWDIHRLIDIIERYLSNYVDIKKIICMGNSGGGTATFYASCYDKRISISIPSCAVCTYDDSIVAMKHCPCNYIPNIRKYFNMGDLGCLIAPRPVVVVCGVEDKIFPLHGVEESVNTMKMAYKSVGKEDLCQLVKGKGGHQFYPDDAWPVVKRMM